MKVTVQLIHSDRRQAVIDTLFKMMGDSQQLEAQLRTQGVRFDLLEAGEVAVMTQTLVGLGVSDFSSTGTSVRCSLGIDIRLLG